MRTYLEAKAEADALIAQLDLISRETVNDVIAAAIGVYHHRNSPTGSRWFAEDLYNMGARNLKPEFLRLLDLELECHKLGGN